MDNSTVTAICAIFSVVFVVMFGVLGLLIQLLIHFI